MNLRNGWRSGNLKIKETKAELKQYSHKLEEALAKTRLKFMEIEKDNEILNKTYMKELKKGDRMHQVLLRVKNSILSLIGSKGTKVCSECQELREIEDLRKIILERVFDTSNEVDSTMEQVDMNFQQNNQKHTRS